MREDLEKVLEAGLAAADPKAAVLGSVRVEDGRILVGGEGFEFDRVFVLAAGKAACAMARAARAGGGHSEPLAF